MPDADFEEFARQARCDRWPRRCRQNDIGTLFGVVLQRLLIETDLFLMKHRGISHRTREIERIIAQRLAIPRPVIVEGVTVLKILHLLGRKADFLIYTTSSESSGSDVLSKQLAKYEAEFDPYTLANLTLQLSHSIPLLCNEC